MVGILKLFYQRMILFFLHYNGYHQKGGKNISYTLAHIHKNARQRNVTFRSNNFYHGSFRSTYYYLQDIRLLEGYFQIKTIEDVDNTESESDNENIESTFKTKSQQNYFHGQDIDFFYIFLLRDVQSNSNKKIAIIPTEIAQTIKDLVDLIIDTGMNRLSINISNAVHILQTCIKNLDIYLFSNPTIVKNKLSF